MQPAWQLFKDWAATVFVVMMSQEGGCCLSNGCMYVLHTPTEVLAPDRQRGVKLADANSVCTPSLTMDSSVAGSRDGMIKASALSNESGGEITAPAQKQVASLGIHTQK